jgi:thiamine pyrophosphate-dependent acetolactate synthase large subunit-like protein
MYKIWFARNYRTHVANTLLLDNALATMGAGLPLAMMAALEVAFSTGGVHIVAVPIDYSENTRFLVEELRNRVPDIEPT